MVTQASAEAWAPPLQATVRARRRETRDVITLELDAGDFAFQPGQFNMLSAFGQNEVPISISGDPARPPLVHTIRAVGPATAALCELRRGERLGLRGPFGRGWPLSDVRGRDVVVVAGGVGLPPLLPAFHALLADRDAYGRIALLYGARSPGDLVSRDHLGGWRARFDAHVAVTVDAAGEGWRGSVGVVTKLIAKADIDPDNAAAFVCGPEAMMRFAVTALRERGLEEDSIWLSLERNMQCGAGLCGHCQLGPLLICRDGPVLRLDRVSGLLAVREL